MVPAAGDVERLNQILGRPLHTYGDFAAGDLPAQKAAA